LRVKIVLEEKGRGIWSWSIYKRRDGERREELRKEG